MTHTTTTTQQNTCASPDKNGGLVGMLIPILLIFVVFYFLIMRPQQKRDKKRQQLIASMKKGNRVLTTGGIIGVVHKLVNDKEISLEISEGCNMRILKNSVVDILDKDIVEEVKVPAPKPTKTTKSATKSANVKQ